MSTATDAIFKDHVAPINLEWAYDNGTTGIRIPLANPQTRRVENRIARMDCIPYLAIAASLACGYLGIKEERRPSKRQKGEPDEDQNQIPRIMGAALDLFDDANKLRQLLGEDFSRVYSTIKRSEYDEFLQVISPWEREHLLTNV